MTLELHVRKDMDDQGVLDLTRWAWERCVGALKMGRATRWGEGESGEGDPEVTIGVVRG